MKNSRWKMNRIGFVNFWLYDEEDFEFADGKLLLRGQNGSGKSITTQSFIPFVLDGDRTPSRLDPFGSSDRRMEYYFLGEEGKDESTGYLYLEFRKDGTDEYRTIGIGQRAKRGRPMDFWGFIILDGRRVGDSISLYKKAGAAKIPFDKRELKAALGEDNFFTDNQKEYKKAVNRYLFGFRKDEQYDQYVRLLVKVRAPKLSKEFKPTKVYDILNDSLQTLSDESLRVMVDAMEKMDEIQESLEMLRRAFSDLRIIRNEYTRYNQYMLGKKAGGYLSHKRESDAAAGNLKKKEAELSALESQQEERSALLEKLSEEKRIAEIERDGLLDSDIEETDRKIAEAEREKVEAQAAEKRWDEKIEKTRERIRETELMLDDMKDSVDSRRESLREKADMLREINRTLQWDIHEDIVETIASEAAEKADGFAQMIDTLRKQIALCRDAVEKYSRDSEKYDMAQAASEEAEKAFKEAESRLHQASEDVDDETGRWLDKVNELSQTSRMWRPEINTLDQLENIMDGYRAPEAAGSVYELLRTDYDNQRQVFTDRKQVLARQLEELKEALGDAVSELDAVEKYEDIEPERDEYAVRTRQALKEAGIEAVPFYRTVEFAESLTEKEKSTLEAQLYKAGILDALVVSDDDFEKIQKGLPEFADSIVYARKEGTSEFTSLTVSGNIYGGIEKAVKRILSNIGGSAECGLVLENSGLFRNGILAGKAVKEKEAEFVGEQARKKKREKVIEQLKIKIEGIRGNISSKEKEIAEVSEEIEVLAEEYRSIPPLTDLNAAVERERRCSLDADAAEKERSLKEKARLDAENVKNSSYQEMLKLCRQFGYPRTEEGYRQALDSADEYGRLWNSASAQIMMISSEKSRLESAELQLERSREDYDEWCVQKRSCSRKVREYEARIRQYEEYLSRPEIAEKAARLKELRELIEKLAAEYDSARTESVRADVGIRSCKDAIPVLKEELGRKVSETERFEKYFEEELELELVIERNGRSIYDCAREAENVIREGDKAREVSELLQSLYQTYQKHNGSLVTYGTALEECFSSADGTENSGVLRRRVRFVSVWNGRKVFLEEFYSILKAAIEETELLIQKKDRELFEDILSKTISQQLTDRIAESRRWVADMSRLMKEMDTSMGLTFSLDWKPVKAENEGEIDISELEQILLRDRELLTIEDIEKVAGHFRSRIRAEKQLLEESGGVINYMELVRDALDYRKWFTFQMYYRRGDEQRKPLTNAAFNRFSGGEKAMAMYVPLFAAVNAQYKKAENQDHPRIIALDEAFAGVDDRNISSMFELVHKLDFDYIMNSQSLWGCFKTVSSLRIAELLRPQNSQTVAVIRYTWNGKERMLDE